MAAKSLNACVVVSTVASCAATSGRTVAKSGRQAPVPICCGRTRTEPSSCAPFDIHCCSSKNAFDSTLMLAPPTCWISDGRNTVCPSVRPLYGMGGTAAPEALSRSSGTGNEP